MRQKWDLMTINQPIRTTGSRRRRFEVVVQPSFLHDVLLSMWSALGANDKAGTHDVGKRWFTDLRRSIPADVVDQLTEFGGDSGKMWLGLIDLVAHAPDPEDTQATLEWLETAEWEERRRDLVAEWCWEADAVDVDAALDGDADAVQRCVASIEAGDREAMERWLSYPAERFPAALASVLRRLVAEVMPDETTDWAEAYRCSRDAVTPLVDMMEPSDLIERITNGIAYDVPLGIRRLVLIPSVSLRPWTLTYEVGDRVYVFYPVADEHLEADPGAPPQWLVRFHKALGDDRRLRMLRRLAESPASLADLTAEVDLAKSTVFHHVGVLRAAGLVRVHVGSGSDKNPLYTLRSETLATAFEHTTNYLEVSSTEERESS